MHITSLLSVLAKLPGVEPDMLKMCRCGAFPFFAVDGRQHICRLKSKNSSAPPSFSVLCSFKRADF